MSSIVSIDSNVLILRWRGRRREILKALPAELRREYRLLGVAIKAVEAEEARLAEQQKEKEAATATISPVVLPGNHNIDQPRRVGAVDSPKPVNVPMRLPRSVQKKKLLDYLDDHGAATRSEITAATGIPPGSLSQLLADVDFEKTARGFWRLKGERVVQFEPGCEEEHDPAVEKSVILD